MVLLNEEEVQHLFPVKNKTFCCCFFVIFICGVSLAILSSLLLLFIHCNLTLHGREYIRGLVRIFNAIIVHIWCIMCNMCVWHERTHIFITILLHMMTFVFELAYNVVTLHVCVCVCGTFASFYLCAVDRLKSK